MNFICVMKLTITYITILFLTFSTRIVFSQVTIAPTNMFIEDNERFGTYMVINNSNVTQEISIDFIFQYTKTDNEGESIIISDDPEMEELYSIADQIKAFPKNFTLAENQRQIVRLRLTPPNDKPDGTYWARISTSSRPKAPSIELETKNTVSARIGINFRQITGLFFKKGKVSTGIEIDNIRKEYNAATGKLVVLTEFNRTGNSPFLGSITASLINENKEEVRRNFSSTSLYFDGVYRNEFDMNDLPNGSYYIKITFETNRSDVSSADLIQMNPVTKTTSIIKI